MITYRGIENSIKDYYLIAREVERLKGELNSVNVSTSRYTDSPKGIAPQSGLLNTVIRRDEKKKDLAEYESQIAMIEKYSVYITDIKEKTVLNCLLENLTITEIAHYLQMSKQTVYNLKDRIIQRMYEFYKLDEIDKNGT